MKKIAQALLVVPMMVLGFSVLAPAASAACVPGQMSIDCGADSAQGNGQPGSLFGDSTTGEEGLFKKIVNILLFIIGAIAVIMLIIGGIRYVTSGGDQNHVTAAKNTILYAIIGIVVAVLAFAVVNFVLTGLNP
jgi:hypothetical protein